jgi:lysozyme
MAKWKLTWAAKFVAQWEGISLTAYLDTIASPPVLTIGAGHTGPIYKEGRWREIRKGDRISRRAVMKYLAKDLQTAAKAVNQSVHVPITVRQRMALISLAFNIGVGAFQASTLVRKLNNRNYRGAANEFLAWKYAGGQVIPGLLNRRRAERWMFTHPRRHGK